jgi:hypothetical protein
MSFWKNLFGGGAKDEPTGDKVMEQETYKGFLIKAIEMKAGSELQLAGIIEKDIAGELKSYRFIRAERMASRDDLIPLALAKGRQIIDEQGEHIFR